MTNSPESTAPEDPNQGRSADKSEHEQLQALLAWRDSVIRPLISSTSLEPADAERLALFVVDEICKARGIGRSQLSESEYLYISRLVMQDQEWARLHATMLRVQSLTEAS